MTWYAVVLRSSWEEEESYGYMAGPFPTRQQAVDEAIRQTGAGKFSLISSIVEFEYNPEEEE